MSLIERLVLLAAIGSALGGTGCAALVGEQTADVDIQMAGPGPGGVFHYQTQTTISHDAHEANKATLINLSLETKTLKDLTFLETLKASLVSPTQTVEVANVPSFPPRQPIVNIPIEYSGDLIPFFPDGHTLTVAWNGSTNPDFVWPAGGEHLIVHVTIEVE
jgi:hypothetical protein